MIYGQVKVYITTYKKKTGKGKGFSGEAKPFRVIKVEETEKGMDNKYILHDAMITTCSNKYPHCHYHIKARKITVVPGDNLKARGVTWSFGNVPVMHMPFLYKNLNPDFGFRFYPGYNSRMGAFCLARTNIE